MEERIRQRRVSQLGGGPGTDDGETLWIEQTQLHQNTRLVPEDVFMGNLAVLESNDTERLRSTRVVKPSGKPVKPRGGRT